MQKNRTNELELLPKSMKNQCNNPYLTKTVQNNEKYVIFEPSEP